VLPFDFSSSLLFGLGLETKVRKRVAVSDLKVNQTAIARDLIKIPG